MKNPDQYLVKVRDLEAMMGSLEGDYSSLDQAQKTLGWLQSLCRQFGQLEDELANDIDGIRSHYGESQVEIAGLFGGRISGRFQAKQKQRFVAERNAALLPYVQLRMNVKRRLDQIETARLDLQNFVYREQERLLTEQAIYGALLDQDGPSPEQQAYEREFCPHCGSHRHEDDHFCRACGSR